MSASKTAKVKQVMKPKHMQTFFLHFDHPISHLSVVYTVSPALSSINRKTKNVSTRPITVCTDKGKWWKQNMRQRLEREGWRSWLIIPPACCALSDGIKQAQFSREIILRDVRVNEERPRLWGTSIFTAGRPTASWCNWHTRLLWSKVRAFVPTLYALAGGI